MPFDERVDLKRKTRFFFDYLGNILDRIPQITFFQMEWEESAPHCRW